MPGSHRGARTGDPKRILHAPPVDERFRNFWRDMTFANRSPSAAVRRAFRKLLKIDPSVASNPKLKLRARFPKPGSSRQSRRRGDEVVPLRPRAA